MSRAYVLFSTDCSEAFDSLIRLPIVKLEAYAQNDTFVNLPADDNNLGTFKGYDGERMYSLVRTPGLLRSAFHTITIRCD